jgi:hypothetical protein
MEKSGSGISIPDHISRSLATIFWVKNTRVFSIQCSGSRSGAFLTRDPGINSPDAQHCKHCKLFNMNPNLVYPLVYIMDSASNPTVELLNMHNAEQKIST